MGKWKSRDEGKVVADSVVGGLPTEKLEAASRFITNLLKLRKIEKLRLTYIDGVKEAVKYNGVDKVFVDYRIDGTATGRLSCASYGAEENMGVSFHTLPRSTEDNIRSIFKAKPGDVFIAADYAAMELRVLAHISRDKAMQEAFISGQDLHTYTAQLLFNKKEISKQERQIAKTVSFLIVYGGGAVNLAETTGISLARAEKIIAQYKRVYPSVFTFMDFVNEYVVKNKYSYTIFGRRRHLLDVNSRSKGVVMRALRQGFNFVIQSTASDILLCSLIGISNRIKEAGLEHKARIVASVHDSIELTCSKDCIEQVCEIVRDEMVNYPYITKTFGLTFDVPLGVDMEVGTSFGDGNHVEFIEGKVVNGGDLLEKISKAR